MVDQSDSSNKYKGTTNSSGVATMTFDSSGFEWSQDSDADFSEGLDFYTPSVYTLPTQDVPWTEEEFKSNFPKGFCVNPMTEYKQPPSDTVSKLLFFIEDTFTKITGQWDSNHKTFTLNEIVPKSKDIEGYFFWADAGGILAFGRLLDQSAKINLGDIDMGISVENIPEKFDISYEISDTGSSVSMILFKEGVIERIQLSNFAFDISNDRGSYFDISIKPKEGVNITLEDWKTVNNVKISFYGKKVKSSDIPAGKVLYGNYDYTVTPPSLLEVQSGTLNVNAPAINKEILIANNTNVTFKVTAKQPLLTRPQIGDFVYGDKTWSTELDSAKTCVGVITDVRSKDFDFIGLENLTASFWTNSLGTISDVVTETNKSLAICDFAGKTNSQNIILAKPTESTAAHKCAAYSTEGFGAGSWFLPSCGQWGVAQLNRVKIDTSISATIGSDPLSSGSYWTSTQYNSMMLGFLVGLMAQKGERPKVVHIQFVLSAPMNTILFQTVYIFMIKIIIVTQKKNGYHLVKEHLMYVV